MTGNQRPGSAWTHDTVSDDAMVVSVDQINMASWWSVPTAVLAFVFVGAAQCPECPPPTAPFPLPRPGTVAPRFQMTLLNGSTFTFQPNASAPIVVTAAHSEDTDPFTHWMYTSPSSIDDMLRSPPPCLMLLASYREGMTVALRDLLTSRMHALQLSKEQKVNWWNHLILPAHTIGNMGSLAQPLVSLLKAS